MSMAAGDRVDAGARLFTPGEARSTWQRSVRGAYQQEHEEVCRYFQSRNERVAENWQKHEADQQHVCTWFRPAGYDDSLLPSWQL